MNGAEKGMLEGTGDSRSVLARLTDLYKGDSAFRGMTDFVVIGAVALMFLAPPSNVKWPWSGSSAAGPQGAAPGTAISSGAGIGAGVVQSKSGGAGLVLPIAFPQWINNPRLVETLLDVDPRAFSTSAAESQAALRAAFEANAIHQGGRVAEILRNADGNDRNVIFMRAVGLLASNNATDNSAAASLLRTALDKGHPQAAAFLGWLLRTSRPGITTNPAEGQRLIEQAAAAGDAKGLRLAAVGYLSGDFGRLDPPRAFALAKKSADAGDRYSMLLVSRLYADGIGTSMDGKEAERYLRAAADGGLTEAQSSLGRWLMAQYEKGLVPSLDPPLALLEKSRLAHSFGAIGDLAYLHSVAAKGPPHQNLARAFELVRGCSGFREALCQFNMGAAFHGGRGTSVDLVSALSHYTIAQELNYQPAAERVRAITSALTPADQQAASAHANLIRGQLRPLPPLIPLQTGAPLPSPPVAMAPMRTAAAGQTQSPQKAAVQPSGGQQQPASKASADLTACQSKSGPAADRLAACNRAIAATDLTPEQQSSAYYMRAQIRYQAKEFQSAQQDFDEAIRRDPKNGSALIDRAVNELALGQPEKALADYDAGLQVLPRSSPGIVGRAEALRQLRRLDEAESEAKRALDVDPKLAFAYQVRASIAKERKRWSDVVRETTAGLALQPQDFALARLRGGAYLELGQHDLAIADLSDIIRRGARVADDFNNRGLAYLRKGQASYDNALADFTEAIKVAPKVAIYYDNRAIIFAARGQDGQAISELDKAIELSPGTASFYARRANLHAKGIRGNVVIGSDSMALADIDKAVELDPKNASYLIDRSRIRIDMIGENKLRCAEQIRRAEEASKQGFIGINTFSCREKPDYAAIQQDIDTAKALRRDWSEPDFQAGRMHQAAGRFEQAVASFQASHRIAPGNGFAAFNAAGILLDQLKSLQEAIKWFDIAVSVDEGRALFHAGRANAYASLPQGRGRREAIEGYQRALRIEPGYEYARNGLRRLGVAP